MKRKDCDSPNHAGFQRRLDAPARKRRSSVTTIALAAAFCAPVDAGAGSVRLWPSAVGIDETVRLGDVCELRGFDESDERALRELVVLEAPPPGGSRLIHMELVRSALAAGGANMASVTLAGATQCAVSRPAVITHEPMEARPDAAQRSSAHAASAPRAPRHGQGSVAPIPAAGSVATSNEHASSNRSTLRQAVIDSLNAELARYGGVADVVFDRTSEQVLDLSGPTYDFKVRRRGGQPLGVTPLEVDVLIKGRSVQTVSLTVQVTLIRRAVVAHRSINQGATIRTADVDVAQMSFTRLDKLGVADVARVVGQRSKRFVPAGTLIEPAMLESVPLVLRGQLVTLTSIVGAVRVTTTAKATEAGLLGEVIKVRAVDNKRVEFNVLVVGPGAVQLGSAPGQRALAPRSWENQS